MKKIVLIVLAVAMLLSLAACGAPDKQEAPNTETPAVSASAETAAAETASTAPESTGAALTKVTVVLDWTPNTNHTGLYVAEDKGYFAENGLDVEIIQPADPSAVLQLLAAGTAQFGIGFQESLTFARDKGVPVVSIGAILQHNTSGFAAPVDRGITSAKDFEGKTYGGWGMDMEPATIKYLMDEAGADFSKVNITTMGDTDAVTAMQMNSIDFAWIYEGWEGISAKLKGFDLSYVPLASDPIFDYYTPIMATSEDMINNNRETVEKFMDAVVKGYTYAAENADESADILLKYAPELDAELVKASQEYLSPLYIDDAESFGVQKTEVWDRYTKWLYDQGFIETMVDSSKAFTNEFVK
jgi:ABC-type nitrate/sulfonate/bicarbonate transport system substrate-binding protein